MTSSDLVRALNPVVRALESLHRPFHIGGSISSSLHGIPRSTLDVDLVAELQQGDVQPLVAALQGEYYVSEPQIVDAIGHRGSFNVIHHATGIKIDVFVTPDGPFEREIAARVVHEQLDDAPEARTYPFSSAEDILLQKLRWYRRGREVLDRQWQDVLGILRVQGAAIDLPDLRYWAPRIDVADLLEQALAER
jgi:hypothetical protein